MKTNATTWQGPFVVELSLWTEHTNVVRYTCQLPEHGFDLYVPRAMLESLDSPPKSLTGIIAAKSDAVDAVRQRLRRQGGFHTSEIWQYSFQEEKENSLRYS